MIIIILMAVLGFLTACAVATAAAGLLDRLDRNQTERRRIIRNDRKLDQAG